MNSTAVKKTLRVLLIEDAEGDAFLIQFYLEEIDSEYTIERELSLEDGIATYGEGDFDIVLLDLNLTDSSDLDTVRRFLSTHPNALVIVLTGQSNADIGIGAVKLGAEDFLVKGSFDAAMLNTSIHFALERAGLRRELTAQKLLFNNAIATLDARMFEMDIVTKEVTYLSSWECENKQQDLPNLKALANATQDPSMFSESVLEERSPLQFKWKESDENFVLFVKKIERENNWYALGVIIPCFNS